MNKIKSILALLLLGGLVATGCADKKTNNGGSVPNNSGNSQSGDSGSGGGQQGGGDQGGGQQGGGQQGGEGGGQQGGGGDVQTNHFANKKLTVESISANPADHLTEIQAMYASAYISLFSEGNAVELILPAAGEFQALLGTYAVSQDGLTATVTVTESYISAMDMRFDISTDEMPPFPITFDGVTSKYSVTMPVEEPVATPTWQATATFVCVAAAEAPTHANIPEPTPLAWPTATIASFLGIWGIEHDTVPACSVEGVTSVMLYPQELKERDNSFFVMLMGGETQKDAYLSALGTAGYAESSPDSGEYLTANQELRISVTAVSGNLMIDVENTSITTYYISNTNDWNIAEADAKFFIWVWDGRANNKWYDMGDPEDDGMDGKYWYFSLQSSWTGAKIVRFNPAAPHLPTDGQTTWGTYGDDEIWDQTGDLSLNPLHPYVEFSFPAH